MQIFKMNSKESHW